MTHGELVGWVLGVHGTLLAGAIAAYKFYADDTKRKSDFFGGIEVTLEQLRRKIARELGERLKVVFDNPQPIRISIEILDRSGNPYSEVVVNPAGSEKYYDALFDFMKNKVDTIGEYRYVTEVSDKWWGWSKYLNWSLLVLICWQIAVCPPFVLDRIEVFVLNDLLIMISFGPTIALLVSSLIPLFPLRINHDRMVAKRREHANI